MNADGEIAGVGWDVRGYNLFAYCMNNPVNMDDPTGHWPKLSTILKSAAIVVVAAAVVAAVVVTVSTFGAGSVAGVAVISASLSIAAKATEVAVLQAKKSSNDAKKASTSGNSGSGNSGGKGSGNSPGDGGSSGGKIAADVIEAVFDNGITILAPSATKALTTGASFAKHDLFDNPVLNSDFRGFMAGPASKLGTATAYAFTAYAWIQTTISIFSDDPVQRAADRGYSLR